VKQTEAGSARDRGTGSLSGLWFGYVVVCCAIGMIVTLIGDS